MINLPKIDELIKFDEGQNPGFKSSFNYELIGPLVAFADTNGGNSIAGIIQNHKLTGVSMNSESVQKWGNEIKLKTSPSIIPDFEIVLHNDKNLKIPEFRNISEGFLVTVFRAEKNKVTNKVTENQKAILEEILKNKNITTSELSVIIGISQRKIKENISKLKEAGILLRVGPAKGGYWEIQQKQTN
jgi:predicted HTH transcriptional regulator